MKRGDLVKRKGENWIGVVIEMVKSGNYIYPKLIWVDEDNSFNPASHDRIDSCSQTLLEVISECK
tara:strand:+ start:574 stop:768 length:195 start_codon:yes stop_codon:yes gene_type:complete